MAVDVGVKGRMVFDIMGENARGGLKLKFVEFLPDHQYANPPAVAAVLAKEIAVNIGCELVGKDGESLK